MDMPRLATKGWQAGTPPDALSAALFGGECIEFRELHPVRLLVERARHIVADLFGSRDPESVESRDGAGRFLGTATAARKAVAADSTIDQCWRDTLVAIGYAADDCYVDRIRLRFVPSHRRYTDRAMHPLPPHRDTWGSGVRAQVNWWMPLYSLAPTRTMIMWPELFHRYVANDSAGWNLETLRRRGADAYPLLPTARETPKTRAVGVSIEPGSLLAFSGAHLHASVSDDSGKCRISLDTRSVWARDVQAGRGAANIDGRPRKTHWEWFRNPADPGSVELAAQAASTEEQQR